jgi:hypothetical protein
MRTRSTSKTIGAFIVSITFISLALISSAATYYFPDAGSDVEVYSDTSGQIVAYYPVPGSHNINSGDDVSINFSCSWDDQRGTFPIPPTATFNYTLTAIHQTTIYYAAFQTTTSGSSSGSTLLNVLVLNLSPTTTIKIYYNTTAWVDGMGNWRDAESYSATYTFI